MSAPSSSVSANSQTYFGSLIDLLTFNLPAEKVEEDIGRAVDDILIRSDGRITSKGLKTKRNELIKEVYEAYSQKNCSVHTLLKCRLFRKLIKVKNAEEINDNLEYLANVSVILHLKALSKKNPKVEEIRSNPFVTTYLAQFFSGLGNPGLIANQVQLYKKLPKEFAPQFFEKRAELSEELASTVAKGLLTVKDVRILIQLLEQKGQIIIELAARYIYLLSHFNYAEHRDVFKTSIQEFVGKIEKRLKEIDPTPNPELFPPIPISEVSSLINESNLSDELKDLELKMINHDLCSDFLTKRHLIDSSLIEKYENYEIDSNDAANLSALLKLEAPSAAHFAFRYFVLISDPKSKEHYQDLRSSLIEGLSMFHSNLSKSNVNK